MYTILLLYIHLYGISIHKSDIKMKSLLVVYITKM